MQPGVEAGKQAIGPNRIVQVHRLALIFLIDSDDAVAASPLPPALRVSVPRCYVGGSGWRPARRFVCGPRRAPLRHFCASRIDPYRLHHRFFVREFLAFCGSDGAQWRGETRKEIWRSRLGRAGPRHDRKPRCVRGRSRGDAVPLSRSAQIAQTVTAFATVINS